MKVVKEKHEDDTTYDESHHKQKITKYTLITSRLHCVQRAPVREVSSRVNLSAYCLNPQNTMHFTRFSQFRVNVALRRWLNRVKCIGFEDLNNRIGKHATKPLALGILGHSGLRTAGWNDNGQSTGMVNMYMLEPKFFTPNNSFTIKGHTF